MINHYLTIIKLYIFECSYWDVREINSANDYDRDVSRPISIDSLNHEYSFSKDNKKLLWRNSCVGDCLNSDI